MDAPESASTNNPPELPEPLGRLPEPRPAPQSLDPASPLLDPSPKPSAPPPAFEPPPPGRLFDAIHVDTVFAVVESEPSTASSGAPPREPPRTANYSGYRRRVKLPFWLFFFTCLSTFWVGVHHWLPPLGFSSRPPGSLAEAVIQSLAPAMPLRQLLSSQWSNGLAYMVGLITILLSHELGHFLMTVRYRIVASLPYFIPMPIIPLGTMGAVIAMDGPSADRRQIFDIGIAGPLAGLVFAVPLMVYGLMQVDFAQPGVGPFALDLPLGARWFLNWLAPAGYEPGAAVHFNQLNPYFMAGWVGFLVTGLNMLPVSQLDGGHVIYCLFGRAAHWIARGFLTLVIAYMVYSSSISWILMIGIVLMIGPDHPPTRDDSVALGGPRVALGWCSLLIPVLCFPVQALRIMEGF